MLKINRLDLITFLLDVRKNLIILSDNRSDLLNSSNPLDKQIGGMMLLLAVNSFKELEDEINNR